MKKYGYYTKEIAVMINRKLMDTLTDKLDDYSHCDLSETTRDQLIAVLDYMSGAVNMADAIVEELTREDDDDDGEDS